MNADSTVLRARLEAWASWTIAAIASAAYGLTFGFTYGVNNQIVYMLGSLRLLDSSVLNDDWLAAHTLNYHPTFAYLGWLLLKVGGRDGWGVGIATVVTAALGALALFATARRLLPRPLALPAFLLTMAALVVTGTREMAGTYAFDPIFQPSMVASAALLASIAPFVAGEWLLSGVLLGVAGLFHANFLVLGLATFGLAHLQLGWTDRKATLHRLLHHMGPPVAVLVALTPLILKAVAGGGDAARAQEILFEIRSPHHYRPRGYLNDFFPFLAWQALSLGLGAWVFRLGEGRGRRFGAVFTALLVVVWGGTFAAVVLESKRATQLFVWRFAPYVDILAQLLVAATVARLLVTPREPLRLSRTNVAVALAGAAGLAVSMVTRSPPTVDWLEGVGLALVAGVGLHLAVRRWGDRLRSIPSLARASAPWVVAVVAGLGFVHFVKEPLASIRAHSNLMTGMPGAETDLYAWLRGNTTKDVTILSPPGLERFRLASERAIVVDWKASTYVPSELLEWYRRLEDVSGRKNFRSRDEVVAGYDAMDPARLEMLKSRYHLTYAVVGRGRDGALGKPVVYSNGQYVVLDLR